MNIDNLLEQMENDLNEEIHKKGVTDEEVNALMDFPVNAMAIKLSLSGTLGTDMIKALIAAVSIARVKITTLKAEIAVLKAQK
jgi:hypothetical protein